MKVLLGQHGSNGDCLYATILARQIKSDHPDCHLTWAVANKCAHVLRNNPYVDEIWEWPIKEWPELETAWYDFERQIKEDQSIRDSYDKVVLSQIWPNNFRNFDGTVRPSILRAYDSEITVPIDSVIELDEVERLNVKKFVEKNNIDQYRHKILFECSSKSGQSYVTPSFALEVASIVNKKLADCCFIITTHEEIHSAQPNIISAAPISFRENLALIEHCTLFVGCGSGVTVISTCSQAKEIPNIQILSKNKSMLASFYHDFEYFGKDTSRFIEMGDVDPVQAANAILSVCNDGLNNARERHHDPIPLAFNFYLETINDWLVKRGHYVDALQSLSITMQRYGHIPELVDFGNKHVIPGLKKDKDWRDLKVRERVDKLMISFSTPVELSAVKNNYNFNHCNYVIEIKNWGGEKTPIRFERESNFNNEDYSQLIEHEIREVDWLIKGRGEIRKGEKHVQASPKPTISVSALKIDNFADKREAVNWQLRYPSKARIIKRRIGRKLSKLKTKVARLLRRLLKKTRKISYKLCRINSVKHIFNGLGFKVCRHLNVQIPGINSLDNDIAEKLKSFGRVAYVGESDVVPKLFKDLANRPGILSEIIRNNIIARDFTDSTAMKLCKPCKFITWLSSLYEEDERVPLIIIDVIDTEWVLDVLEEKLMPGQVLLINLHGSKDLEKELVTEWEEAKYVCDEVLYLSNPTYKFSVKHRLANSGVEWPKISVVTVSYNQARFIEKCIISIVNQGYPNLEYIIVDGGSTDGTLEILDKYKEVIDVIISEPDNGQSDALNKGFDKATGDILTWICSDDELEPNSLFHVGSSFDKYNVDIVTGECRIVDEEGALLDIHHNGLPYKESMRLSFGDLISFCSIWHTGMYFYQPELFFSKEIWRKSGAYLKEHLYYAMDYDLFLRFAMAGATIVHIPHIIGVSRKHESQKTQSLTMEYLPTIRAIVEEYKEVVDESKKLTLDNRLT